MNKQQEYAVSIMMILAKSDTPVTVKAISKEIELTSSSVEKLMKKLRENVLVKSQKGVGGGYLVNGNPDEIPLTKIMIHFDTTKSKFSSNRNYIYKSLESITLDDLLSNACASS